MESAENPYNARRESMKAKLEEVQRMAKERPCKNCSHYRADRYIHCAISTYSCDSKHSAYDPIETEPQMG